MAVASFKFVRCTATLWAFVFITSLATNVSSADDGKHMHLRANGIVAPSEIRIGGELARPLVLDTAMLSSLPRKSVRASAHGIDGEWSGVSLIDILQKAGVPSGDALRGKNLALYVSISAADGYRVVYALAELDTKFTGDPVILADHRDGKPLSSDEGPFRIIAPAEKRPGRWIRQVTRIDVLRAPD